MVGRIPSSRADEPRPTEFVGTAKQNPQNSVLAYMQIERGSTWNPRFSPSTIRAMDAVLLASAVFKSSRRRWRSARARYCL